jgi:FixJ family two-component response regulator
MTSDAGVVYVIDDDASVRRALARLIAAAGLDVETFPSAEAFLHHPAADRPACLVLDVRLPGESGLDLQTTLGDVRASLPIIFVTGHGTISAGVQAMKEGAVDFLQKPVDERELLGGIQRALDRSREARATLAEQAELERRLNALTGREREVLDLVVTGMLNKQIGERLGVAEKTIKVHRGRVMQKMAATSVAELVRMLHKLGLQTSKPLTDSRPWDQRPIAEDRRARAE